MDYEKKYKGALARCKWLLSNGMISKIAATDMFRELMDNDENIRKEIINIFHSLAEGKIPVVINYADIFTWLEKQGGQKPQRMISAEAKEAMYGKPAYAWSEEDETKLKSACALIKNTSLNGNEGIVDSTIDWLKSLKDRYAWKPNIAQLNALSIVSKGNAPDDIEAIVSLYNDLKKLTE